MGLSDKERMKGTISDDVGPLAKKEGIKGTISEPTTTPIIRRKPRRTITPVSPDDTEQTDTRERPPLPTINLFESDAFREHTTVIGTPVRQPGDTTPIVDVPTGGVSAPRYSRVGVTATPEELEDVEHKRQGIIPIGLPLTQEEKERQQRGGIARSEYRAEQQIPGVITPWQQRLQGESQDAAQQHYNELMNERARELGMTYNADEGVWYYTSEQQLQSYESYHTVAKDEAMEVGREHYQQLFLQEQPAISREIQDIFGEEYGKEGFTLVETGDGQYQLVPTKEYERQQRYKKFKEGYQQRVGDIETAGPIEKIGFMLQLGAHGLSAENPLGLKTIYETYLSPEKGRKERIFDIHAQSQFSFEEAIKEKGPIVGPIQKFVEPGGPVFTAATAYAAGAAFGVGFGAIGQISKTTAHIAQIATGGYFLGRGVAESEALLRTGYPMRWGGFLGLLPMGLQREEKTAGGLTVKTQPLTPAERFAAIGMMGFAAPFAFKGYKAGYALGQKGMSKFYQPKFVETRYVYPRIKEIVDTKQARLFKGDVEFFATRQRTIFGRTVPWGKETYFADLPLKGVTSKQTTSFVDPTSGKTVIWQSGETLYELGLGKIFRKAYGITLSQKYTGGAIYKTFSSRPFTTATGKKTGVMIDPFIKQTGLGYVVTEKPKMALTLTPRQLGTDIFKPTVSGQKFYPSSGALETSIGKITTKAIAQVWTPSEKAALLEVPHRVPIQVKFIEPGEKIPGFPEDTKTIYGVTKHKEPSIYVVERPPTDPFYYPKDIFGRIDKTPLSGTMIHELIHRRLPFASEVEVQALSQKRLPSKQKIIEEQPLGYGIQKTSEGLMEIPYGTYEHGIGIEGLKKAHKITYPVVDKAVKQFWKTGELGLYETHGVEQYQVSPFRQISVTKGPKGIIVGKTYGASLIFKGIKLDAAVKVDVPIQTFMTKQTLKPMDLVDLPVHGRTEITLKDTFQTVVAPDTITSLWKDSIPIGYVGTSVATGMLQEREQMLGQRSISKQGLRERELLQQRTESRLDDMTKLDVGLGRLMVQENMQMQILGQEQKMVLQPFSATATITPTITIASMLPIGAGMEQVFGVSKPTAYHAMVKKRQYVNGKRIRGTEWTKADPHAYSREDALAVASHVADNTAKRSIKIVAAEGKKPRKRPSRINTWADQIFEYRDKGGGVMVETNMFAIDSPGEIREISQRGWEARKKKGSKPRVSTKKGGVSLRTPSIKGIVNKISRRLIG